MKTYGIHSTALDWVRSYLCDRRKVILFDGVFSTVRSLCCDVQGSVLGPLLFLFYAADLGELAASLGLSSHFYADDSQVLPVGASIDSCTAAASNRAWYLADRRMDSFKQTAA